MRCPNQISHVVRQGDSLYRLAQYYQTTVPAIRALNPQIDSSYIIPGTTVTICPGNYHSIGENSDIPDYPDGSKALALFSAMREVWSQHIYWTRMVIISITGRLKDQQDTIARLLRNPGDLAKILACYYPAAAVKLIEQLLTEHLQIGAEVITALRDKDSAKAREMQRQWHSNADEMAQAFVQMNPRYIEAEVQQMFYKHLGFITDQATLRLAGKYSADIAVFDKAEAEMLMMADYFSRGIIAL